MITRSGWYWTLETYQILNWAAPMHHNGGDEMLGRLIYLHEISRRAHTDETSSKGALIDEALPHWWLEQGGGVWRLPWDNQMSIRDEVYSISDYCC